MRDIAQGLHHRAVPDFRQFIQQQREDDRRGKSEEHAVETHQEGVPDESKEVYRGEEIDEMLESDPGAVPYSEEDPEVLEGNDHAIHRRVVKDDVVGGDGEKE